MIDKPTGGEAEYDLLATLITDELDIIAHTAMIAADNPTWGILRCRMAAIIDTVAGREHGWTKDAERRCLILARFPAIGKPPRPGSNPCHSTPPGSTHIPPNQTSGIQR